MSFQEIFQLAILSIIADIPKGSIKSYGQIASEAHYPNHARQVGRALKNLPRDSTIPWHRVINSKSEISFLVGGEQYQRQKCALEAEGWKVIGNKVLSGDFNTPALKHLTAISNNC